MNDDDLKKISFDEDGQPVISDNAESAAAEETKPHQKRSLKEKVEELGLEIEVLKSELENARQEKETYIGLAQRQKAEFENFKKRNLEQSAMIRLDGLTEGVLKVLPVYDALIKAQAMIKDESTLKGLNMIMQQLLAAFKELGVEKIDSLNAEFDPDFHNAIMNEEAASEEEKGRITEVFQEGFTMGGRVLRYAMVKVTI